MACIWFSPGTGLVIWHVPIGYFLAVNKTQDPGNKTKPIYVLLIILSTLHHSSKVAVPEIFSSSRALFH